MKPPTRTIDELRDILSKVLLDGQNQIHDLKDGKATPEEITERMFASLDYWTPKFKQDLLSTIKAGLPENKYVDDKFDDSAMSVVMQKQIAGNTAHNACLKAVEDYLDSLFQIDGSDK